MRKAAYISGVSGLLIFALALTFSMHHIEGASLLIGWGTLFNEAIVLPVIAVYVSRSDSSYKSIQLLCVASLFILIAGLFFKTQHWPGSLALSNLGIIMFCISAVLFAKNMYRRDMEKQKV